MNGGSTGRIIITGFQHYVQSRMQKANIKANCQEHKKLRLLRNCQHRGQKEIGGELGAE